MIRIGITGQSGFIGSHLYSTISLYNEEFEIVDFKKEYFLDTHSMDSFVLRCDVIVHLAGLNRHVNPNEIYITNIKLVESIIASLERTKSRIHFVFSSSSQEEEDNLYGKSKRICRQLLMNWAKMSDNILTAMIIPNVFGPFCKPHYNSVVATFAHQVSHGDSPVIQFDKKLNLIYVGELVNVIIDKIRRPINEFNLNVKHTMTISVSKILDLLYLFYDQYQKRGEIPELSNLFELNLFNTYRSYINLKDYFPVKFSKHTDLRGVFIEIVKGNCRGQFSFSTTERGVTRGNHFHTRKIERFAVIKGQALVQLRKIGTDEIFNFKLSGDDPGYIDMPIWYTHNIKNIGDELLFTNFWINEPYDPKDPDTFFENV